MNTKRLFIGLFRFFVHFLVAISLNGCKKEDEVNQNNLPKLAKIIDWEAANWNKDTVPEYTVQYDGDKITSLTGKYGEYMHFKYDPNPDGFSQYYSYNTLSRIVRTRKIHPGLPEYIDTLEFKSSSFDTIQGVAFTTAPVFHTFLNEHGSNSRKFISPFNGYNIGNVDVNYNGNGDISSIHYLRQWEQNLEQHTVEVSYTNAENSLRKVYKLIDAIDPSALSNSIDLLDPGKNASYFPYSIHYGSNCISSFKITTVWYYNNQEISREAITHNVTYQFNSDGYITKILIDNKPFKEFIYI
jgi:hypothetical protein